MSLAVRVELDRKVFKTHCSVLCPGSAGSSYRAGYLHDIAQVLICAEQRRDQRAQAGVYSLDLAVQVPRIIAHFDESAGELVEMICAPLERNEDADQMIGDDKNDRERQHQ